MRSPALVRVWKKCSRMREYVSIDPEMSQMATSVGRRVACERRLSDMGYPPVRRLARRVRRASIPGP